jgi:hypothetical protein
MKSENIIKIILIFFCVEFNPIESFNKKRFIGSRLKKINLRDDSFVTVDHYFDQQLDHFNNYINSTWKQVMK